MKLDFMKSEAIDNSRLLKLDEIENCTMTELQMKLLDLRICPKCNENSIRMIYKEGLCFRQCSKCLTLFLTEDKEN